MSDDRFSAETWEPDDEPDLSGPRHNLPSALSDRDNAAIHYALQEFTKNMSEHEVRIGRELTGGEKFWHLRRFEAMLRREYGAARPDPAWLSRHEAWCSRNGSK